MKKIVTLSIVMMMALQLSAQDAITKFFSKYEDDDSFTHVQITKRMFSLFTDLDMEDPDDKELMEAISKLDGLKILAKDDITNGKALYKEAFSLLPAKEYDELMSVRDEDTDMKFMIKEKNGIINELLMVMGGNEEFFIMSLVGDIDLKQIARLSKGMDIDGLEGLEKLNDKN
ncbi:DUF4252 domain-containing protein [Fulvivirga sedimenti]|uniref:DUF4252 domain-containing protein n=1 Tax=Fulvivirga sedimenti TaxID=2879465 RepID=A0A9X1HNZ4_9BACT|nr:DUF4252 domain-containing protein [Fulvivirga sedimenti]MCA6073694.1 DUF4252 domain-containing protein [Fulvivirga sedimenti]